MFTKRALLIYTLCISLFFAFMTSPTEAKRCLSPTERHIFDKLQLTTSSPSLDLFSFSPFWSSPDISSRLHSRHNNHQHQQQLGQSLYSYVVTSDEDQTKLVVNLPGLSSKSVKLTISTKTDPASPNHQPVSTLTIEPRGERAENAFQAHSFTLDPDVDLNSLTSSMTNGELLVVAQKVKPKVLTTEIPITTESGPEKVEIEGNGEEPDAHAHQRADPPSPNDSPDVEIFTEPE